jgi:hypothetical protein
MKTILECNSYQLTTHPTTTNKKKKEKKTLPPPPNIHTNENKKADNLDLISHNN